MGLAETLAARLQGQGRTAQVTCGDLGSVTVEALPLRELEGLLRGPDPAGSVFFAACRELQAAGETLRKAGQLYTPAQVTQFVSGQEAEAAMQAVLLLSGWDGEKLSEVRLSPVQEASQDIRMEDGEVRLSPVQTPDGANDAPTENRLETVQTAENEKVSFGQVSREAGANFAKTGKIFNRTQALGSLSAIRAQNVVSEEADFSNFPAGDSEAADGLHETESDSGEGLHESTSELARRPREIKSESSGNLHEAELESLKSLHETESESAERTAQALLEGLRRASWVRGG